MQKMSFTEVHGDLFTSSDSLVHCVSRDLHMGKGIAAEFKKQFGGVDELRQQSIFLYFYLICRLNHCCCCCCCIAFDSVHFGRFYKKTLYYIVLLSSLLLPLIYSVSSW